MWKTKMHTIQLMELQEIELIAQDNRTTPAILCCITRSCPCGRWLISFKGFTICLPAQFWMYEDPQKLIAIEAVLQIVTVVVLLG